MLQEVLSLAHNSIKRLVYFLFVLLMLFHEKLELLVGLLVVFVDLLMDLDFLLHFVVIGLECILLEHKGNDLVLEVAHELLLLYL